MSARLDAAIAANRLGLGARPGALASIAGDPRGWLLAQLEGEEAFTLRAPLLPTRAQATDALLEHRARNKSRKDGNAKSGPDPMRALARDEAAARFQQGVKTSRPFAERLALFWGNHLTVSTMRFAVSAYAGLYEREAIRPSLQGSYTDLLLASALHPAMLLYLDQASSVGPHSRWGSRREAGLNENFAREVMELHSLGVAGGYSQTDVRELALALTGWTLRNARTQRTKPGRLGEPVFIDELHEPGDRTVLGRFFAASGAEQAPSILRHLARQPATARRVATRLARHFSADSPPEPLVKALEASFVETGGDLPSLHRTLVAAPEVWRPEATKIKSPNELLTSTCRALGLHLSTKAMLRAFSQLGQVPFRAESPEGWPDDAAHWMGPDALHRRLQWAEALSRREAATRNPGALADAALGPRLSALTRQAVQQAESPEQALVLFLMSPEFQRR